VWCVYPVHGLAPHEVLVIANRNEPVSVALAQTYIRNRDIPRQNLVFVQIESSRAGEYVSMSRDAFTRDIWDPVQQLISQRDLKHILAWVYSTHIPFRIDTDPPVSLHGLTFVRNRLPTGTNDISRAEYVSPIFLGPSSPNGRAIASMDLSIVAQQLRANMPIPSMSFGFMGARGNTKKEIQDCLARGLRADATSPTGSVFFVQQDDIRSKVRTWQFPSVVETLQARNVIGYITNAIPQSQTGILGVMMGNAIVNPTEMGAFMDGAIGEHLTSFGAMFDHPSQTKISSWISAGASGTAGTVCEPLAIWAKFPHARMYAHYVAGCSLIESFYYSVRMPLQTYFIGDPLATPWKSPARMRIGGVEDGDIVKQETPIDLYIQAMPGLQYAEFHYFINGKLVGEGTNYTLKPQELAAGLHTFRAVAYEAGPIRNSVTAEVRFRIVE
jgi:uncharacterized protein (TIGR03790 family)